MGQTLHRTHSEPQLSLLQSLEVSHETKIADFHSFLDNLNSELKQTAPGYHVQSLAKQNNQHFILSLIYDNQRLASFDTQDEYEEMVEPGQQQNKKKIFNQQGEAVAQEAIETQRNHFTRVPMRVNDSTGEEIPLKNVDSITTEAHLDNTSATQEPAVLSTPLPISDIRHITFEAHPVEYQQLLQKEILDTLKTHQRVASNS